MKSLFLPAFLVVAAIVGCSDSSSPVYPTPVPTPGPQVDPLNSTFEAVGDSATVAAALNSFRSALGGALNAPGSPPQTSGRREINWDGVPANLTNVDNFPSFFFNVNSARGAVFTTPGTGFRVDSTDFTSINPALAGQFRFFSQKKTFMPVGSQLMDVHFFLAGQEQFANVTGFGVMFSDVDRAGSTKLSFFDANDQLIGTFNAPARSGSKEFSFLGVLYTGPIVARVRITSGDAPLNGTAVDVSNGGTSDLVVMDDFVYGEPRLGSQ
jgi:hypothetical protein